MGTTRPIHAQQSGPRQQYSYNTRPSMIGHGQNYNGQLYGGNVNYNCYNPVPPPPRPMLPPQALSFIRPPSPEILLPPGVSELPSTAKVQRPYDQACLPPPPPPPPIRNPDGSYAPLIPPPLPPLFPYLSQELAQSLYDGAKNCGKSFVDESSDLPFIPVIVNDKDLKSMISSVKTQFEETQQRNLLLYEDIIDPTWPKELRDMFKPLYCVLCKLTLTSPVVARDHYKGKRHNKGAEIWMQNNPHKVQKVKPFSNGSKLPSLMQIQGVSNPNAPISGTVNPIAGKVSNPNPNYNNYNQQKMNGPPVYENQHGYDRTPFRAPPMPPNNFNSSMKRNADGNRVPHSQQHQQSDFIPAYRAALASPGPSRKKPKKEGGGGPNFGYCPLCDVHHTSAVTAGQHYSGKNHKAKLLLIQQEGQQGRDSNPGVNSQSTIPFNDNRV